LGQALAIADEVAAYALRRRVVALPDAPNQRLVLLNASERPFDDYFEIEPWLEWTAWQPEWGIVDEKGRAVPYQVIAAESAGETESRLVLPIAAAPGELRILRIAGGPAKPKKIRSTLTIGATSMAARRGPSLDFGDAPSMVLPGLPALPLPALALYDDRTDTWSHGVDRYACENRAVPVWAPARVLERGPLMASFARDGTIGGSKVQSEWRLYAGKPWVELRLRVLWTEEHRILKLEWEFPQEIAWREDGILGGSLVRPLDGRELPVRDWVSLQWEQAGVLIVAPGVFAADCGPKRLGLTLLRSCVMACHDPNPGTHHHAVFSDRGEHCFLFRFLAAGKRSASDCDTLALALQRPLLTATTTRGMQTRALRGAYQPSAP
jgi:hypothetical protein